jgi:hypothetical protein
MHLSKELAYYAKLVAVNSYLLAVERNDIPLLNPELRTIFIEKMIARAVLHIDSSPVKARKKDKAYQARIRMFFNNPQNVLAIWRVFEIKEAEADGRLSPEKIVGDLLEGKEATYAQKSTLESYAVNALNKAKAKGLSLSMILNSTRQALQRTPVYRQITHAKVSVKT